MRTLRKGGREDRGGPYMLGNKACVEVKVWNMGSAMNLLA